MSAETRYPRSGRRGVSKNSAFYGVLAVILVWLHPVHSAEAVMPAPGDWSFSEPPPYSCRLLYDEQKKCAFGGCDKRVIERLTKECLRDGGRP